jgi:hypothetical protein
VKRLRSTDDNARERLPLDDPSVDALDGPTRERVALQWEARARAELRVASVFAVLIRELLETGADPPVLEICARAVSDEVRHAEICRLLAARYAAREIAWPPPERVPPPPHASAPDRLRPTLRVVAMGCINETIASAWLEASLKGATAPIARAAIRELVADDVHHARLGWAHLASPRITSAVRSEIAAWMPRLLDTAAKPWLKGAESEDPGVPHHGVPSAETTRGIVHSTVRDVILPGLEMLGVNILPARAWVDLHVV